jgi:tryptophanyl-tRNA synthetase
MHNFFSSKQEIEMVNTECRQAGIGCVQCKQMLAKNMNSYLEPFRERRAEMGKNPDDIWDMLEDGKQRAQKIASQTLAEAKDAIGLP